MRRLQGVVVFHPIVPLDIFDCHVFRRTRTFGVELILREFPALSFVCDFLQRTSSNSGEDAVEGSKVSIVSCEFAVFTPMYMLCDDQISYCTRDIAWKTTTYRREILKFGPTTLAISRLTTFFTLG